MHTHMHMHMHMHMHTHMQHAHTHVLEAVTPPHAPQPIPSPSQHHPILGTWRSSRIVAHCPWAFVGFAGCGRGLFARSRIPQGQAICEYGGPRLPLHMLEGQYVLQVPGRGDN